jgi:hypothetical protein
VKIRIIKIKNFPVILYGRDVWSLTLKEEHSLRVFENNVLRIFGPKNEKCQEASQYGLLARQLHSYRIKEDDMDMGSSMHDKNQKLMKILARKTCKTPLGMYKNKWDDNIKIDFKERAPKYGQDRD